MQKIIILFFFILYVHGVPLKSSKASKCGYDACTSLNPDELNVHIIAHSHDDVGWLKTVDEYYYGGKNRIQLAGVQYIIDSVIRALKKNRERKFIQVESAFFVQWWREQNDKRKQEVIELVNNGQLEIVGGAWSMNDESAAHYHSIIDQFTFGLKSLEDILGKCARPKIGWQIDPFGHTREMASLFAQMGYDALFFARLDWRDKMERLSTNTAEMLWRGSANLGDDSLLFTHVMYNHYSPPPNFYFDVLSNDDPLVPDEHSPEYNLKDKIKEFTTYVSKQARNYTSNNIMIAMGNDFTYQDANYNFKNLDILIKAYKDRNEVDLKGRRIRLLYSTPGCYTKAVNDEAKSKKIGYKVKTDDFIPYASDYHTYWSGYYTSRPTQKRFERQGNNFLQIAKQLTVFAGTENRALDENLNYLRSAMGIMQHHDAIPGTEKQPVADDYARIVMGAFDKTNKNINQVLPKLLAKPDQTVNLNFEFCLLANVSHCLPARKQKFVVAIYNPLSRKVNYNVRIPVNSNSFTITDPQGASVPYQLTPSIHNFNHLPNIDISKFDLVFVAKDLPPLGVKLYHIENTKFGEAPTDIQPTLNTFELGDENNGVVLNHETGFTVSAILNKLKVSVRQEMMYYLGAQGNNMVFKNRSSGAYIFRPHPDDPEAKPFTNNILNSLKVYKGDLVDEAHQTFNEWTKQIIRVYKNGENHIEFDWLVGPIDVEDGQGKEVISRFQTNIVNDVFYTDSNGREILTRRNDHRATYNYSKEEAIAANYYPITSGISIADKDRNVELGVLNDRAQGGANLKPGQIELMVHRRLLRDDAFGVGEPLNETEFGRGLMVRGQHYLTMGSFRQDGEFGYMRWKQRDIAQRKLLAPWIFIADATNERNSLENLRKKLNFEFVGLKRDLPEEIQILTLEPWRDGEVLMRFEHIREISEGGEEQIINLNNLFTLFKITDLKRTTLAAHELVEESQRLRWRSDGCLPGLEDCLSNKVINKRNDKKLKNEKEEGDILIRLSPMEIDTYIVKIQFI